VQSDDDKSTHLRPVLSPRVGFKRTVTSVCMQLQVCLWMSLDASGFVRAYGTFESPEEVYQTARLQNVSIRS